jgi:hypothetical protein
LNAGYSKYKVSAAAPSAHDLRGRPAGKLTPTVEPQILWIQTFGGGGGMIRPRVNWTPIRNTTIGVGVDIFTGPDDGFFGRYDNRAQVYTEVRYDF